MRSEPSITVTCDRCTETEIEFEMTALAQRGSYDDRGINKYLERYGWRIDGDEDICDTCVEEEQAE